MEEEERGLSTSSPGEAGQLWSACSVRWAPVHESGDASNSDPADRSFPRTVWTDLAQIAELA